MILGEPNIGIVMPTLNQYKLALEAIASIRTLHRYFIVPVPNYKLNLPLAGAWNLGICEAIERSADYILVVNDDILFSEWTIDGLVQFFNNAPAEIVMVTGYNLRGQMEQTPTDILSLPRPTENLFGENPDFACYMITPRTIEIVGNFDENFTPAYFEDNDYHYRVNLSGHKAVSTTIAPYFHYGSRTQNAGSHPVVPGIAFEVNRAYYVRKWGGEPGHESHTKPFNDASKNFRQW